MSSVYDDDDSSSSSSDDEPRIDTTQLYRTRIHGTPRPNRHVSSWTNIGFQGESDEAYMLLLEEAEAFFKMLHTWEQVINDYDIYTQIYTTAFGQEEMRFLVYLRARETPLEQHFTTQAERIARARSIVEEYGYTVVGARQNLANMKTRWLDHMRRRGYRLQRVRTRRNPDPRM